MRRTSRVVLAALLLAAPGLCGCGGERTERGLAPAEEQAVPESNKELGETEAERQAQVDSNEGAAEAKLFKEAEQPEKGADQPEKGAEQGDEK